MEQQSKKEEEILLGLQSKREIKRSLQKRSKIVLKYTYKRVRKNILAEDLGCALTTINRWIDRWSMYDSDRLIWYREYKGKEITEKEYIELLSGLFKDSVRTGKPSTFDEETKEKIVALAVSSPESLGLPFTRWSEALLQLELIERKIVKSISTSHIGRILKKSQNTTPLE